VEDKRLSSNRLLANALLLSGVVMQSQSIGNCGESSDNNVSAVLFEIAGFAKLVTGL